MSGREDVLGRAEATAELVQALVITAMRDEVSEYLPYGTAELVEDEVRNGWTVPALVEEVRRLREGLAATVAELESYHRIFGGGETEVAEAVDARTDAAIARARALLPHTQEADDGEV